METRRYDITTMEGLTIAARAMLKELGAPTSHARVLALYGDLGAGKTAFTKVVAKELGVSGEVTSPTFMVMKRYETSVDPWISLVHIDAYRLESVDELLVLGFREWLLEPDTIMVIEWADKVESLLPADAMRLRFTLRGEERVLERLPS